MFKPITAYKACIFFALFGALVSVYLLVHHLELHLGFQNGPSICSINKRFDCDQVARSAYSEFLHIPVAGLALFYFLCWLLFLREFKTAKEAPEVWSGLRILSVVGLVPTIFLATITFVRLGTVCIFCMMLYFTVFGLAVLTFRVFEQRPRVKPIQGFKKLWQGVLPGSDETCSGQTSVSNRARVIAGAAIAAILAIVVPTAVLKTYRVDTANNGSLEEETVNAWRNAEVEERSLAISDKEELIVGEPTAPTVVTVYSDFACPHCKSIAHSLEVLATNAPIMVIFKNFPLDMHCNPIVTSPFHNFSCRAAKICYCAGLDGKRLEMHDRIFNLKRLDELGLEALENELKMSSAEGKACLENTEMPEAVKRHISEGVAMQMDSTPAVFVNGKRVGLPTEQIVRKVVLYAITHAS